MGGEEELLGGPSGRRLGGGRKGGRKVGEERRGEETAAAATKRSEGDSNGMECGAKEGRETRTAQPTHGRQTHLV